MKVVQYYALKVGCVSYVASRWRDLAAAGPLRGKRWRVRLACRGNSLYRDGKLVNAAIWSDSLERLHRRFAVSLQKPVLIVLSVLSVAFITTATGAVSSDDSSKLLRSIYVLAFGLLMFDVLVCARIARGTMRDLRNVHFWIYAFDWAVFVFVLIVLVSWESDGSFVGSVLPSVFLSGTIGYFVASTGRPRDIPFKAMFDEDKPRSDRTLGGLYYIWPLICVCFFIPILSIGPDKVLGTKWVLFQLILFSSLMPYYPTHRWFQNWPRLVGAVLFIGGYLYL